MQTQLKDGILKKDKLQLADNIIRNCVHCGFCIANCPTYRLLGNELDSPRGRIYLIKKILEGEEITAAIVQHLERCLMCRACETTCPSGVEYFNLLEAGKDIVSENYNREYITNLKRFAIRKFLTSGSVFNFLIKIASVFKPLLSRSLKQQLPAFELNATNPKKIKTAKDKVLLLRGCVQPVLAPEINNATIKALERLSVAVELDDKQSCCGAIDQHLGAKNVALMKIKANVDRWYEWLKTDVSCLISNISGCGATVKDYPEILADDAEYVAKAKFIVEHTLDIAEYLQDKDLSIFKTRPKRKIAFHSPCTLQHWQKINQVVEDILKNLGFDLVVTENSNICCGAAGTYSMLHSEISNALKQNKLNDLTINQPDEIVSANIGCIKHLAAGTSLTVKHWVELL